jgi:hypothetical protein
MSEGWPDQCGWWSLQDDLETKLFCIRDAGHQDAHVDTYGTEDGLWQPPEEVLRDGAGQPAQEVVERGPKGGLP